MTREEAIGLIKPIMFLMKNPQGEVWSDAYYALDMAIKALEQIYNLEKYMNHLEKIGQYGTLKKIKTALEYEENKPKTDTLEQIQKIVEKWKADSWTDGLSYECMSKIAELMDSEVEQ